jgi:glycosyl transferase family 25
MKTKIYIINLERAAARYQAVCEGLRGVSVPVVRVPGVDGNALSDLVFWELTRKNRFSRPLLKTEAGCYLSHLQCLKKIVEENLDFGIVLEDDAVFSPDFEKVLLELLDEREKQKTDWELLKMSDCGSHYIEQAKRPDYSLVECHPVPARFLAQIWTRSGAEKFLARYTEVSRPVDIDIKFVWEHGIRVVNVLPDLVRHAEIPSTIGDRERLRRPFFKNSVYRAGFILRRILWSVGKRGLLRTLKLEGIIERSGSSNGPF